MKKITRITSLALGLLLSFGIFSACNDTDNAADQGNVGNVASTASDTHYAKISKRSDYIVKNGQSYYTLVVPKAAERYETKAADLLVEYYEKALGVSMPVITDDKATNKDGRYISIGDTTLLQNSGISIPEEKYNSSGFRILTKGNTVYIAGARTMMRRGTYYGVQEFLKHTIDWEAYTAAEIYYQKTDTVEMRNFDVVEIPDFDFRRATYQTNYDNNEYSLMLRMTPRDEEDAFKGLISHSHFQIIDPNEYYSMHQDWFYTKISVSDSKFTWDQQAQLCLTNEEMTAEFIKNVTQMFIETPKAEFIHIGQADNSFFCNCNDCTKWLKDRDTNEAGLMVDFTNRVARGVTENIKKVDPNRKLTFECFAYLASMKPPTKTTRDGNGNKVFVADHPDVIPDENVMIQFTPIAAHNMVPLNHVNNQQFYDYFQGWSAICDNISVWNYGSNFRYYMIGLKNWDVVGENFNLYREGGVKNMYEQCAFWHVLLQMREMRLWIYGKMLWNNSLNWNDLAKQFIEYYYGPSAKYVQEYYDYMTTYCEKLRETEGYSGNCYFSITDEKYWTFSYVEGGRQIFMRAYEDLKKYEGSADYDKYYWRLTGEYFENMFMQLEYHMGQYSKAQSYQTLALFKETRGVLGLTLSSESGSIPYTYYENIWEDRLNAI